MLTALGLVFFESLGGGGGGGLEMWGMWKEIVKMRMGRMERYGFECALSVNRMLVYVVDSVIYDAEEIVFLFFGVDIF